MTEADEVLCSGTIDALSDLLHESNMDGKGNDISNKSAASNFAERLVGSSEGDKSAHDVLAAPSVDRVDEAMGHVVTWLHTHYDDRHN